MPTSRSKLPYKTVITVRVGNTGLEALAGVFRDINAIYDDVTL